MNSIRKVLFLFCLFFMIIPLIAQTTPEVVSGPSGGDAWIIPIRGDIGPFLANFVRRESRRALSEGAEYLIFEIDTFGGRVDSALQITSFITSLNNVRTIAWVNNSEDSMGVSWSAGALIAFSCTDIYMAPGTSMGAAAPVIAGAAGQEAADEKTVAAVRSQIAALAERNGHPISLALAMVDLDIELWEVSVNDEIRALTLPDLERLERDLGGVGVERLGIISERGKLLSLTAGEALRFGLISELIGSREALRAAVGIRGQIVETSPSNADFVISFLTSGAVQSILILIGIVMIYLEIQSPGLGIPGVIAILAFVVVFGSSALLGRVGSMEIIIFLIGVALLVVEIFVTPGFGFMGVSGILMIGLSLVLSMQDFVIPRFDWEWTHLGRNVLVVLSSLLGSTTAIAVLALFGPKIFIFDRLTLKTAITGTSGGPDTDLIPDKTSSGRFYDDNEDYAALIGKQGIADSVLRPSGRASIDGESYSVDADNEFVDQGTPIIVTRVRGNRIIVRKA
ncbi:MAG: nodulation protein NfeD [Treponema sp.]|nr:nodulation protein NfeD [Treponema sp.]